MCNHSLTPYGTLLLELFGKPMATTCAWQGVPLLDLWNGSSQPKLGLIAFTIYFYMGVEKQLTMGDLKRRYPEAG